MGPAPERSTSDERLYDEYLEQALTGEIPAPEDFLARHPEAGPELRSWIDRLHRSLHPSEPNPSAGSVAAAAPAPPGGTVPSTQIGEFRLLRRLGEGATGIVYLAEQPSLDRLVALKMLRREHGYSEIAIERFEREAKSIAKLHHPSIVRIHTFGAHEDVRFLAMELVPGRALADEIEQWRCSKRSIPVRRVLEWGVQLASALECAHSAGIVHRDVKPSNVRIGPDGRALLLDFGLAVDLYSAGPRRTQGFVGSPAYASPEQIQQKNSDLDGRTDIYSLGATLYEALTGSVPIDAESMEELLVRIPSEPPTPPRRLRPDLSRDVETVLLKALEKDPAKRYASARDLREDLEALLDLRPIRAMPLSAIGRGRRWVQRNPRAAAAAFAPICGAVMIASALAWRDQSLRVQQREEAASLVRKAADMLTQFEEVRTAGEKSSWKAVQLRGARERRPLSASDEAELLEAERAAAESLRGKERILAEATDRLSHAERLDHNAPGIGSAWASLYFERWREARANGNTEASDRYRQLVLESDSHGEPARRVSSSSHARIQVEPTDAQLSLELAIEPGPQAHTSADAWSAIPTASLISTRSAGNLALKLDPGSYRVRARSPQFEELVFPFHVDAAADPYAHEVDLRARLLPVGTSHPGFVRIATEGVGTRNERSFWMMLHEVTQEQYLEFLLDRAASSDLLQSLIPRPASRQGIQVGWEETNKGPVPPKLTASAPVLGVSLEAARAFAAWFEQRFEIRSRGLRAGIPTLREWRRAAHGGDSRRFAWGSRFNPRWTKSAFSRDAAGPETVGSYPIDCSPYGILDLTGSAAEWCTSTRADGTVESWVVGGAWDLSAEEDFDFGKPRRTPPETSDPSIGFRLVLRDPGP
ncbi:MAG: protein kinase [Planctomycetes bacterium]|nr:protein kinase [Planctomycetota bacterium]